MKDVTAAILIWEGKIFIAKRKPDDSQPSKWEFPGGKIKPGETPEACLEREMTEEFGMRVRVGPLLGENIHRYAQEAIRLMAYLTAWKGDDVITPVDHEAYRWVSVEQLGGFDFSPADIPFVQKLIDGTLIVERTL